MLGGSSCNQPPPSGTLYFPLDEDRTWVYRIKRTTLDGKSEIRQHLRTVYVGRKAGATEAIRQNAGGDRYKYEIREGAVYRLLPSDKNPKILILPTNTLKGTRWNSKLTTTVLESSQPPWEKTFKISVSVPMQYEVLSTRSKVMTSAGSFDNCLHIRGKGSIIQNAGNYIGQTTITIDTEEWFAPNVGIVKILREERTSSQSLSRGMLFLELMDWQ